MRLTYPNAQIAECKVNSLPHPLTVFPAYIYLHHPHNPNLNNLIGQLKGVKKTPFLSFFFKLSLMCYLKATVCRLTLILDSFMEHSLETGLLLSLNISVLS